MPDHPSTWTVYRLETEADAGAANGCALRSDDLAALEFLDYIRVFTLAAVAEAVNYDTDPLDLIHQRLELDNTYLVGTYERWHVFVQLGAWYNVEHIPDAAEVDEITDRLDWARDDALTNIAAGLAHRILDAITDECDHCPEAVYELEPSTWRGRGGCPHSPTGHHRLEAH